MLQLITQALTVLCGGDKRTARVMFKMDVSKAEMYSSLTSDALDAITRYREEVHWNIICEAAVLAETQACTAIEARHIHHAANLLARKGKLFADNIKA